MRARVNVTLGLHAYGVAQLPKKCIGHSDDALVSKSALMRNSLTASGIGGLMTDGRNERALARVAIRFFWAWLTIATSASIAGNVTQAIINGPRETGALAAAVAVVPPVVLLGSTHSVALLIKARRGGATHWAALSMTLALAACAFTLSFDALTDLARSVGMASDRAWLWPCAIDVSIAQSTLALLALTTVPQRHVTADAGGDETTPDEILVQIPAATTPEVGPADDALERWREPARELVEAGVTSKDPAIVARILAEHHAGTPPSTIGRRLAVHHSTVNRILAKAAGGRGA